MNFKQGRLTLYTQSNENLDYQKSTRFCAAFTGFLNICLLHSLAHGKIIRSIIFALINAKYMNNFLGMINSFKRIIKRVDLHESGTKVDLIFLDESKVEVDIRRIERVSEAAGVSRDAGSSSSRFQKVTKVNSYERIEAFD